MKWAQARYFTEQTCYLWRREYGGMRVEQTRMLKDLEKENGRLKRLAVDLTQDNAILKEMVHRTSEPVTGAEGGDSGLERLRISQRRACRVLR